jgi:starch synthase
LNFLKTGLTFADTLTTVSPRYAQEIQSSSLGWGMEGILQYRRGDLFGILNGADYSVWNPATDPHLGGNNYTVDNFAVGKQACKAALQRELGLPVADDRPLLAMVGRLSDQKGFDLVANVITQFASDRDMQWILLGTGDPKYHDLLLHLASKYPEKVAVRLEFSDPLAHRIEAGADMFLMPSRYEPSGLNQLYSLKYGTPPVVHATGGLADTITDLTDESLAAGRANGFSFDLYTAAALAATLERACQTWKNRDVWQRIIRNGMNQDWSWTRSAEQYGRLYANTLSRAATHAYEY